MSEIKLITQTKVAYIENSKERLDICSWREVYEGGKPTKKVVFDINHSFLEDNDREELSKKDIVILINAMKACLDDAIKNGY